MVVIKNEDSLIFFSVAYIPYDIKDIKLFSKPLIISIYQWYGHGRIIRYWLTRR